MQTQNLKAKADELRQSLPRNTHGTPPEDTGIRLATFPRPEGEWRLSWNTFEERSYVRFQFWKSDDGGFWPVKGQGFSIKVKELPDLAEGISKAIDMAMAETKKNPPERKDGIRLQDGTDLF